MTVATQQSRVQYLTDGTTTTFAVPYYFFLATDLRVAVTNTTTDVTTVLNLNSDYTVSGAGAFNGGSINTSNILPAGSSLDISRVKIQLLQSLDLVPNGVIPSQSLEATLDNLTMMVQQMADYLACTIQIPLDLNQNAQLILPPVAQRANMFMAFDNNGNAVVAEGIDQGVQSVTSADTTNTVAVDNTNIENPVIKFNLGNSVDGLSIIYNPATKKISSIGAVQNPTAGDICTVNSQGVVLDSGKAFSNDQAMGGASPSANLIPTQSAVSFFVKNSIVGLLDYLGGWNASTNSPTVKFGVGVAGQCYLVTTAGTQTGLNGGTTPVKYELWDAIICNPSLEWEQVSASDVVLEVNGQRGIVTLTLADIADCLIQNPQNGDYLVFESGKWVNKQSAPAFSAGDMKHSFQKVNHQSIGGWWMIANGQAITQAQFPQAYAIFGGNLPNLGGYCLAMATANHGAGSNEGAWSVVVPVPYHVHGMNGYNQHTHGDDHVHYDDHAHSYVYWTTTNGGQAGQDQRGGGSFASWNPSTPTDGTSTKSAAGYGASTSYKSQSGSSASTSAVNDAPVDTTDGSGTDGVQISVMQPTYFTENIFIFCC